MDSNRTQERTNNETGVIDNDSETTAVLFLNTTTKERGNKTTNAERRNSKTPMEFKVISFGFGIYVNY